MYFQDITHYSSLRVSIVEPLQAVLNDASDSFTWTVTVKGEVRTCHVHVMYMGELCCVALSVLCCLAFLSKHLMDDEVMYNATAEEEGGEREGGREGGKHLYALTKWNISTALTNAQPFQQILVVSHETCSHSTYNWLLFSELYRD